MRAAAAAQDAESRILARLSAADASIWKTTLPMAWVPVDTVARMFVVAADVLFADDVSPLRALGRASAHDGLKGVYRMLMKVVSIPYAMEQSARLWATYNDRGAVSVEHDKRTTTAVFAVKGYPSFPDACVEETAGYIEGLVQLCGSRVTSLTHARTADGTLAFTIHWV